MSWDSFSVKGHLRYTAQKLGQQQAKHDSQATITRADIATLVQQGNVILAREKAEKWIQEETLNDVLEVLEMEIGVVLENFQELEQGTPGPVVVEAAATIIYAAPYVNSRDFDAIRNILFKRLGTEFMRSVKDNRDGYVSQRVLKAMEMPVPSAYHLDYVLHDITKSYDISWSPDPPPREFVVNFVSECLNTAAPPNVDVARLRKMCLRGLPDEPSWLRPRVWKILFGLVSPTKSAWATEIAKQRDSYYDFVRRLLKPNSQPSESFPDYDEKISEVYKELSGLPRDMFSMLEEEPEAFAQCPLNDEAPEDIRIPYARILDSRLNRPTESGMDGEGPQMPEIRLETEADLSTPEISITGVDSDLSDGAKAKTLLPSRNYMFGNAHDRHCSALLRLLYLHNAINPAKASSHTASLLVPLYTAMLQEVETDHLAHVEADTFWILESIVAEFYEIDEDGGQYWMTELGKRLGLADSELFTEMELRGLNPALPHYSFRWFAPLLSHTLPFPALFQVWDALFSRDIRGKGSNPKIDYLVDICLSMILRGKNQLHGIWKSDQTVRNLWTGETEVTSAKKDSFLESLAFLQTYDIKSVGGVERILQTTAELTQHREQQSLVVRQSASSLASRFNFWGPSAESTGERQTTEMPKKQNSLASQITDKVWRGITNQIAMESPPAEVASPVEMQRPGQSPVSPTSYSSNIWGYAEKIKESDTLATLSKVSTNWRARGFLSSWNHGTTSPTMSQPSSIAERDTGWGTTGHALHEQESEPEILSPSSSRFRESSPTIQSPQSAGSLVEKTKAFFAPSTPKSAPKPLLLNSSRLSYGHSPMSSMDGAHSSAPDTGERDGWAEVMKTKRQHFHRDSQSSVSSLSPSDAFARTPRSGRSDRESETMSSRIVPLKRGVSPMAPHYRRSRDSSGSSDPHSPPAKVQSALKESTLIGDVIDSNKGKSSTAGTDSEASEATSYQVNASSRSKTDTLVGDDSGLGLHARSARVRTRRQLRSANLDVSKPDVADLAVEWPTDEQDSVAKKGDAERPRKISTRVRKVSAETREDPKSRRESAAVEGDDEGYDDLLSAYDSDDAKKLQQRK